MRRDLVRAVGRADASDRTMIADDGPSACCSHTRGVHFVVGGSQAGRQAGLARVRPSVVTVPSIASCDQTTSVAGICRRPITHAAGPLRRRAGPRRSPSPPAEATTAAGLVRPGPAAGFEHAGVQCFPMSSIIDRPARYIGLQLTDR